MAHSTRPSTCAPRARRTRRALRAAAVVVSLAAATVGCGKKGPPLAPFVRVPAAVSAVTPQRIGGDVFVSFTVPDSNADGQQPASLGALEIYAVTSVRPPETEEQRELATLVATLPVREILPALPPIPGNASPPPPLPVAPGVVQGATAAVREALTPETRVEVELPVDDERETEVEALADDAVPFGPVVAPPPTQLARRHYFVVAISPRGRESTPSTPVAVPLEEASSAPGKPDVANTVTELTITWAPSPNARTATFELPPTAKPVTGANATPATVTPKLPAPLPPLQAKAVGMVFDSQPTRYHVYDVTPPIATEDTVKPDPFALKVPAPLTPAPIVDTEFVIKGVTFGVERCFEVRPVDQVFGATVIGPASPTTCMTPMDTFPPAAPTSLAAIAGAGVINLIWDPNTESDLAGYIVLRGEAQGGTLGALQAITPEPITVTTYRDETVKPGTRYVYAVVAVDKAVPQNVSPQSNRAEETARQ